MEALLRLPIVIIVDAFKSKRITLLCRFLAERQRATGCRAADGAFTKRETEELLKLGWVTKSGKGVYFRAWHTMLKGRSKAMATFPASAFSEDTVKLLLYMAVVRHLYRLQERKPTHEDREAGRTRTSLHEGGVAHSTVCKVTGRSKTWSSSMRALCHKHGLATFTRRWAVDGNHRCKPMYDIPLPPGSFITHNGVAIELSSDFQFHIPVGIQWCRRRKC